ncbi:MAG: DUF2336 domain-containing protein [Xanthobacteraceae bacterium]|nr:DUF2336 domain-containing protein [Xanthobacteraceae bacterium]
MSTAPAPKVNLLDELQTALAHGTVAHRVETLRRVTDLFLHAADQYSDEQIDLFDDVFHCLMRHIETSAKVMLSNRLAPVAKAPPQTVQTLAFDDLIEIAAPMLTQSERLTDDMLIANAQSKSQAHLLAISSRRRLSGAVTDVLIERGNDEVLQRTAGNPGASFSESGYRGLLAHAERDEVIAVCLGSRPSIPRHHFLKLVEKASASVRARLAEAHPDRVADISAAVTVATQQAAAAPEAAGAATEIAHGLVQLLYDDGRLDEREIAKFAAAGKFDETNAAIACLARVPVSLAEAMMVEQHIEGILILAKVSELSWPTVQLIIALRARTAGTPLTDLDETRQTYERLRLSTAQQVLRFHKMQQSTASKPRS